MLFRDFNGQLWLTLHQPNNSPNERPMWLEVAETGAGLALRTQKLGVRVHFLSFIGSEY